jgi:hypothetical protein
MSVQRYCFGLKIKVKEMLFFKAFHNNCSSYVQYLYHLCRRGDILNVAWVAITQSLYQGYLLCSWKNGQLSSEK